MYINFIHGKYSVLSRASAGILFVLAPIFLVMFFNSVTFSTNTILIIFIVVFYRILISIPSVYFYDLYRATYLERYRLLFFIAILGFGFDIFFVSVFCFFTSIQSEYLMTFFSFYIPATCAMIIHILFFCFYKKIHAIKKAYKIHKNIIFVDVADVDTIERWSSIIYVVIFICLMALATYLVLASKLFHQREIGNKAVSCMIGFAFWFIWLHYITVSLKSLYKLKVLFVNLKKETNKDIYSDAEHILESNFDLREKVFSGDMRSTK